MFWFWKVTASDKHRVFVSMLLKFMEDEINKMYLVGVPESLGEIVEKSIGDALRSFRDAVRYEGEINVVVFEAQPEFVIPEIGLMGRAIGKQGIEIYIDFGRRFASGKLKIELAATTYHEAAHLAREHFAGFETTLLGAMVSEGVSCYIEQHFFPQRTIPYIAPVDEEQHYLEKARSFFDHTKYDYSKWFFGSQDFPKWVGYRLGFIIVEEFMEKTEATVDQLVRARTQDVFLKSGI